MAHPRTVILSDNVNVGKSTSLYQMIENYFDFQAFNGCICLPEFEQDRKHFNVSLLPHCTRAYLTKPKSEDDVEMIGKFQLSRSTLIQMSNTICHPVEHTKITIIDEIGPLETKKHRGLYTALQAALQSSLPLLLIVRDRIDIIESVTTMVHDIRGESPVIYSLQQLSELRKWIQSSLDLAIK